MTSMPCRLCGEVKDESKFQYRKDSGKRRTECQQCRGKLSLARYHSSLENKKPHHKAARKHSLKMRYGMSLEDFDRMHSERGGLCDICSRPNIAGRVLIVDHEHGTGRVRGLLCQPCNLAIGQLQDSPEIIRKALRYVEGGGMPTCHDTPSTSKLTA